ELARVAEHVDGDDRARAFGDRGLDRGRIHVQGDGVDVGEDRRRALEDEAVRRRDERQRRGDRLVAGPESRDVAEHVEPGRPAGDRRGVRRADALGRELLEPVDRRSERQPPRAQHLEDELLLPLVDVRPGERDLPNGLAQASAAAAGAGEAFAYSNQWAQRSLFPLTVSRYAVWIASVTGPGGPISWSSTSRIGVTSAAVPHMNTSSAR